MVPRFQAHLSQGWLPSPAKDGQSIRLAPVQLEQQTKLCHTNAPRDTAQSNKAHSPVCSADSGVGVEKTCL